MPVGIGIGLGISLLLLIAGCAVIAAMMNREMIGVDVMGYGAVIVLLMSSYAGAMIAAGAVKRRRLMVCGIHAGLMLAVLLLINAVMFGGSVSGLGATAGLLLAGAGCAALTDFSLKRSRRARRRKWPTG